MSTPTVIRIVADTSQAQAQVAALDRQISTLGRGTNVSGLASQFTQTGSAAESLASKLQAANNNTKGFGSSLGGLSGIASRLSGSFGGLTSIIGGFIGGLAVGAIQSFIGGIQSIASNVVEATAQVQSFKASLTTVLGDTTKAGQAFDALATFAAKTPFSLDQAVTGFLKLKALGLTPSEAALTSYGNTAASMGKSLDQMVEAVADAATGEFERLKEFGIKSKVQGDQVAFTFQGVTTKVANNSQAIQGYLMDIGNTKFAGAMDRQAATIGGAISNLKDNIFQAFAAIGQGKLAETLQSFINGLATGVQKVTPLLGAIGSALGGIFSIIGSVAGAAYDLWSAFNSGQGSISLLEYLTLTFNLIGQVAGVVANTISQGFQMIAGVIGWLVGKARGLFGSLFSWLPSISLSSTQSVGNAFIGILRAVKYVALNIPQLFKASVTAVGDIFGILGSRLIAFFRGNFAAFDGVGAAVSSRLAAVGAQAAKIGADAKAIIGDVKGTEAAKNRLLGRNDKGNGPSLAELAVTAPLGSSSGSGKKDKGKSEAEKAAERAAQLADQRAKAEENFFQTLQEQADAAGVLKTEAEKYNKELELRKILNDGDLRNGRQLTDQQKARIATLIDEKNKRELIRDLQQKGVEASQQKGELERRALLLTTMTAEQMADQLRVDQALADVKKKALETGVPLTDALVQNALKEAEAAERTNAALERKNALLETALSYERDVADKADPRAAAQRIFDQRKAGASALLADRLKNATTDSQRSEARRLYDQTLKGATKQFADDLKEVSHQFSAEMFDAFDQIAGKFSGGGLGRSVGGFLQGVSDLGRHLSESTDPNSGIGKAIGKVFSKDGAFMKTLGKIGDGFQTGTQVAEIGKKLWSKFSTTGSQIGGTIGKLTGIPGADLVGSIIGGTIGGLVRKAKTGSATIQMGADGSLTADKLTGSSGKMKAAASEAGQAVVKSLTDIATRLGGDVTGNPSVSIGLRDGKYRVDTTGSGITKTKKGAVDFGKDGAGAAIQFAIQDAIKDGVITGLSSFSDRLLRNAKNLDSAVSLAESYEKLLTELAAMDDPLKAGARAITDSLDKMVKMMTAQGATAAELANVERYRQLKLKEYLDQQLQPLTDFRKTLKGDGSGVTGLSRLNSDLAQLSQYRTDLSAGKTIDQQAFTELGQEIFGLARDLFGQANPQFQSIRQLLLDVTDSAIQNTTTAVNDATVVAINSLSDAQSADMAVANDIARQQLDVLKQIMVSLGNSSVGALVANAFGGGNVRAVNGAVVNRS